MKKYISLEHDRMEKANRKIAEWRSCSEFLMSKARIAKEGGINKGVIATILDKCIGQGFFALQYGEKRKD